MIEQGAGTADPAQTLLGSHRAPNHRSLKGTAGCLLGWNYRVKRLRQLTTREGAGNQDETTTVLSISYQGPVKPSTARAKAGTAISFLPSLQGANRPSTPIAFISSLRPQGTSLARRTSAL